MEETFEELVTRHTRRELEEIALNMGVENLGGTKSQLADAIVDARNKVAQIQKEKEPAKPAIQVKQVEVPKIEKPIEVSMVEKPKAATKEKAAAPTGKNGVMAKTSAIDKKADDLRKAGKKIRQEGINNLQKGVSEFNKGVDSQISENQQAAAAMDRGVKEILNDTDKLSEEMRVKSKELAKRSNEMMADGVRRFKQGQADFQKELKSQIKSNEESVSRFRSGAREIRISMDNSSREFQKAGREIREEGIRNMLKGVKEFRNGVDSQIRDNRDAIAKIGAGAAEIQGKIRSFQGDIQRFQEQDLKNYVRDFYYG